MFSLTLNIVCALASPVNSPDHSGKPSRGGILAMKTIEDRFFLLGSFVSLFLLNSANSAKSLTRSDSFFDSLAPTKCLR